MPESPPIQASLSEQFHVATRNMGAIRHIAKAHEIHYQPWVQQLVATAPKHLDARPKVSLPDEDSEPAKSLADVITRRVSSRAFGSDPLSACDLATLLRLGNAVREVGGTADHPVFQRNVPNSGGLGSIELYPIIMDVDGVSEGIYHFDSVAHHLSRMHDGPVREWLARDVFYQLEFSRASVALVLVGAIGRLQRKYGQRGYRFALLDAGHVSENLNLAATSLDLVVCPTAGFIDHQLDLALEIDGMTEASLLVVLVGTREPS